MPSSRVAPSPEPDPAPGDAPTQPQSEAIALSTHPQSEVIALESLEVVELEGPAAPAGADLGAGGPCREEPTAQRAQGPAQNLGVAAAEACGPEPQLHQAGEEEEEEKPRRSQQELEDVACGPEPRPRQASEEAEELRRSHGEFEEEEAELDVKVKAVGGRAESAGGNHFPPRVSMRSGAPTLQSGSGLVKPTRRAEELEEEARRDEDQRDATLGQGAPATVVGAAAAEAAEGGGVGDDDAIAAAEAAEGEGAEGEAGRGQRGGSLEATVVGAAAAGAAGVGGSDDAAAAEAVDSSEDSSSEAEDSSSEAEGSSCEDAAEGGSSCEDAAEGGGEAGRGSLEEIREMKTELETQELGYALRFSEGVRRLRAIGPGRDMVRDLAEGISELWEANSKAHSRFLGQRDLGEYVKAVAQKEGQLAAASGHTVSILDVVTGELVRELDHGVEVGPVHLEAGLLATGCSDGNARVYSTQTWQLVCELDHGDMVWSVHLEAGLLATGCKDSKARVYSTQTWQLVRELDHGGRVESVHLEAGLLATGCWDSKARVYSTQTWQLVRELDHGGRVESVHLEAGLLATGCEDGRARVLDLDFQDAVEGVGTTPMLPGLCATSTHVALYKQFCKDDHQQASARGSIKDLVSENPGIALIKDLLGITPFELAIEQGEGVLMDDLFRKPVVEWIKQNTAGLHLTRRLGPLADAMSFLFDGRASVLNEVTVADLLECLCAPIIPANLGRPWQEQYPARASAKASLRATTSDDIVPDAEEERQLIQKVLLPKDPDGLDIAMSIEVIMIPDIMNIDKFTRGLCGRLPHADEIFGHRSVRALLKVKWEAYARRRFLTLFGGRCLLLTGFILWSLAEASTSPGFAGAVTDWLPRAYIGPLILEVLAEAAQFRVQGFRYFTDPWNISTITALSLVALSPLEGPQQSYVKPLAALTLWATTLAYLRGFEATAAYIDLIVAVACDVLSFMLILLLIVCGFAHTFVVMGMYVEEDRPLTLAIMEAWNLGVLGDIEDRMRGLSIDGMLFWLFLLMTACATVALTNLLIAVISNTFDKRMEVRQRASQENLAKMIRDVDALFDLLLRAPVAWRLLSFWAKPTFKEYLIFSSVDGNEDRSDTEWQGRVAAIKKSIRVTEKQLGEKVQGLEGKVGRLEDKVDEILQLLRHTHEASPDTRRKPDDL